MSLLDQLPKVIRKELDSSDVKAQAAADEKPFLLCCSRDIEQHELELLKSYDKVFQFHESFRNIPLNSHEFRYGLFDLREKVHRDALQKEDLSRYHVVCVISLFDSRDDFVFDLNSKSCIRSFPQRQAFRNDFERLLLTAKIRKPSILKSLLRFLCFLSDGYPRE
jgi:hypothetical protein